MQVGSAHSVQLPLGRKGWAAIVCVNSWCCGLGPQNGPSRWRRCIAVHRTALQSAPTCKALHFCLGWWRSSSFDLPHRGPCSTAALPSHCIKAPPLTRAGRMCRVCSPPAWGCPVPCMPLVSPASLHATWGPTGSQPVQGGVVWCFSKVVARDGQAVAVQVGNEGAEWRVGGGTPASRDGSWEGGWGSAH